MYPGLIAYQGAPGAFSEEAAWYFGGQQAALLPCASFASLFDRVVTGQTYWGIVPIENTLAGPVQICVDLMAAHKHELVIVDTIQLRITYALIAGSADTIEEIRKVWSHPMALRQCKTFFACHPRIEAVSVYDSAGAVQLMATRKHLGVAAIANTRCVDLYGGRILRTSLEDNPENYTRFLLITHLRNYSF